MGLSKLDAQRHQEAEALIARGNLRGDERLFVLEHFNEAAVSAQSLIAAHFTPMNLAYALAMEVDGGSVIDLCAGNGRLAYAVYHLAPEDAKPRIVCVERNPAYVRAGRAALPEAQWLEVDVLEIDESIGRFGTAIANPPFGVLPRSRRGTLKAQNLEYAVIEVASRLAQHGVFLLPQAACPFQVSGTPFFKTKACPIAERFERDTGIKLHPTSQDTSVYLSDDPFRHVGAGLAVEIVTVDFTTRQRGDTVQHQLHLAA
jgi:hypothetical protein